MPTRVFLSHAGADREKASRLAEHLRAENVEPILDRDEVEAGDSLVRFMEDALHQSDYCLVLWSEAAAKRPWVQAEWEAALYRSVEESRSFLLLGRLEDYPLPRLLAPRFRTDLFPEFRPGLDGLLELWSADRGAEETSGRPVKRAKREPRDEPGGATVYVTSELFGRTVPWRVSPDAPAGLLLDELVRTWQLPSQVDVQGKVGFRLNYGLGREGQPLDRSRSLAAQGVGRNTVLWLMTELVPFASAGAVGGTMGKVVFRDDDKESAESEGRMALLRAINDAGLGVY